MLEWDYHQRRSLVQTERWHRDGDLEAPIGVPNHNQSPGPVEPPFDGPPLLVTESGDTILSIRLN